ncbi:DUF2786 domain-containing protein [Streptacidiphilus rugosus]|uniref:DUF2786 domain-containing protein n=1 Tax=Streptacidiphilus rugosus TaxID=405783 RepID=UPI0009FE0C31|nr:DUF2786 domain-containing protein [Streptacidiphilus rugosus]
MSKSNQQRRARRKHERAARERHAAQHHAAHAAAAPPPPEDLPVPELVSRAVHAAGGAHPDLAEVVVEDWASRLAARASERGRVDRELLNQGEQLLSVLWGQAFWRPADLVRLTRRRLKPAHVALAVALIAAEARRYSPAAFDRRWTDQLREIEAVVRWERDEAWLDEAAAELRLDRFSALACLLELLGMWSTAPVLTQVGPVPGRSAAPRPSLTEPVAGEPKLLARIRALLAKAESTEYPEEAEAFTAKAQELMTRHSIDEALLAARSGRADAPGACRIGIDSPYENAKALLLDAVAQANRARSVWDKQNGFCTVVGFESDLDAVELLFTSLLVQAVAAMNSSEVQRSGRSRSFRQSFLVAYASRIRERLTAATAKATAEATVPVADAEVTADPGELLPVLAAREEAVEEQTAVLFPRTTTGRAIRATDWEGWQQGQAAADRARLHGHDPALDG